MEINEANKTHTKSDLWHLLFVNTVILGLLLGLFFYNRQTQFLEQWFTSIF